MVMSIYTCRKCLNHFPSCRRLLTPLQQTTFENIVTKVEIAQTEQFLLLSQCVQLFSVIIPFPLFIEIFNVSVQMFSKSSAIDLLYVGKG